MKQNTNQKNRQIRTGHLFRLFNISILCCVAFLFFLCYGNAVFAGNGIRKGSISATPFAGLTSTSNGEAFAQNAVSTLTYTAQGSLGRKIKNIITLAVDEQTSLMLPNNFVQAVTLQVEYKDYVSDVSFSVLPTNPVLQVNYDKLAGQTYKAADYITLTDKEVVRITILSAVSSGSSSNFNYLKLTNEMQVEWEYSLITNPTVDGAPRFPTNAATPPPILPDVVNFNWGWTSDPKHTATQLEWVWVEDAALSSYGLTVGSTSSALFSKGATRIDIPYTKHSFDIPLLYDGNGRIYARFRPVSYDRDGNRTDGQWSDIYTYQPYQYDATGYNGHQPNLNWQASTTFAEEGKSKTVITYFDGSLRSRQTVTKDNDRNKTVTAETMYDYQGRAAIQILPTPGIDGIIRYQSNLNLFNSQPVNTDPADYFDKGLAPANLINTTGSSRYYSSQSLTGSTATTANPNTPDAQGYPYSLTRFMPDATGRIKEQSGVGATHKIGSDHTTKYFYTMPTQEELDALFGTEVGDYTHYSKNMVKDANGQVSVSYVDMHGRTIATALAGKETSNLKQLDNFSSAAALESQLLKAENNIVSGNTIESISSVATSTPDFIYDFTYNLDPPRLQVNSCDPTKQYCLDLIYDVEFSITNDNEEDPTKQPIILKFSNAPATTGTSLAYCTSPLTNTAKFHYVDASTSPLLISISPVNGGTPSSEIKFSVKFPEIGTYTVRKTLILNEASLAQYKGIYEKNAICSTLNQIINNQYEIIKTQTGCATSQDPCVACSTLTAGANPKAAFRTKMLNAIYPGGLPAVISATTQAEIENSYAMEVAKCNKICNNNISHSLPTIREMMLLDMMPFTGQYATEFDKSKVHYTLPQLNTYEKYNIFQNKLNLATKPFYKFPLLPSCTTATCVNDYYYDNLGLRAANLHDQDPAHPGQTFLQNIIPEQFEQSFQNSWAKSLLPYHPEYKKLIFAETYLAESYNWINAFNNAQTWAEASNGNFLYAPGNQRSAVPVTAPNAVYTDKLFIPSSNTPGLTSYQALYDMVNLRYNLTSSGSSDDFSMWQMAYAKTFCSDITDPSALRNCMVAAPKTADLILASASITSLDAGTKTAKLNSIWNSFKGIYSAERNNMVNTFISNQPNVNQADCEAIATENNHISNKPATEQESLPYRLHFAISNLQQAQQSGAGSWWPTINGQGPTGVSLSPATAATDNYTATCEGYIGLWKAQLLECNVLAAKPESEKNQILNEITSGLKAVCILGSDAANQYGSSNVPSTVTVPSGQFASFEEVINTVFQNHNISRSNLCNPYMIEWPKPYGKGPTMIEELTDKVDSCNCAQFNLIKIEATNAGYNANNLSNLNIYLQNKYGTTITSDLFAGLLRCSELKTVVCKTKYDTITYNSCVKNAPCIMGLRLGQPSQQKTVNNIYSGLSINKFSLIEAKKTFYNNKALLRADNPTFNCTDLTNFANDFIQSNDFGEDYESCRNTFTQNFNNYFNTTYSFSEIINIYKQNCCNAPQLCLPIISCENIIDDKQTFINIYGLNPDECRKLFVEFFNSHHGLAPNTYNWSDIQQLFADCNIQLNLCVPAIECEVLNQIVETFRGAKEGEDCKTAFTYYFNHNRWFDFKPEYSYEEIMAIYMANCGKYPSICPLRVNCEELQNVVSLFHNSYPGIQSSTDCETVFSNFFNCHFSIYPKLGWDEIIRLFRDNDCNSNDICIIRFDCELLSIMNLEFKKSINYIFSDLSDCHDQFENFFNSNAATILNYNTNHWFTYNEIVDIYQNSGCQLPDCSLPVNCSMLNLAVLEYKYQHQNDDVLDTVCKQGFIHYVDSLFAPNPTITTWAELLALFQNNGCSAPNICNCDRPDYCPNGEVCDTIYQGSINLYTSTPLPYFLKCGGGSNMRCISCGEMVDYVSKFKLAFPNSGTTSIWNIAPVTTGSSLTDVQIESNTLFAKFVNYKSGLQYNWMEYITAINNAPCNVATPIASQAGNNVICGKSKPLTIPEPKPVDPCQGSYNMAVSIAQNLYNNYVSSKLNDFTIQYINKFLEAKNAETFKINYQSQEYHYTLYYYDQAGNLVKTVPPAGVHKLDATQVADVKQKRIDIATNGYTATNQLKPAHTLTTNYRYNTLNQVVAQNTPDAGTSNFWYDELGRLAISQNAKQAQTGDYSYTLYDLLGRITEVGQSHPATALTLNEKITNTKITNWLKSEPANQVTRTQYDVAYFDGTPAVDICLIHCQQNLRNRVSYTAVYNNLANAGTNLPGCHNSATYFSYDIHGNVDVLVNDYGSNTNALNCSNNTSNTFNNTNQYKKITYDYDLISGKVNQVNYQPGMVDQFYHRYNYDAENRLTSVETSHDDIYWEQDASYNYYQHGPLQRTVLGQQQVQGLDYAYTLQGWLKGVNTTNFNIATNGTSSSSYDMGQDGEAQSKVAKDAFGFGLQYYANDYRGIGNSLNNPFKTILPLTPLADNVKVGSYLYNGNISSMLVNIPSLAPSGATDPNAGGLLYGYAYDQLNRIVAMNAHTPNHTSNLTYLGATAIEAYKERVTYDPNGNILTYQRNGNDATHLQMDNLTYGYNKDANNNFVNNKLRHVKDAIGNPDYVADIDDQNDDNYEYDAIGNLIIDRSEGIYDPRPGHEHTPMIEWTVYGKIAKITKKKYVGSSLKTTTIKYTYDAAGNRISKVVTPPTGGAKETWYVRDAGGNTMSIYEKNTSATTTNLTQTEVHLYGSSRLGVMRLNRNVSAMGAANTDASSFTRGIKNYELSNHLGNVLVTITDKVTQVDDGTYDKVCTGGVCIYTTTKLSTTLDGIVDAYTADVVMAQDYYPFGMAMPGRSFNTDKYRYGFNGKENDKDISEGGQDYGMRIYDSRLGKFLSEDPITYKYPMLTPYQFASNRPIDGIDEDGLEWAPTKDKKGNITGYNWAGYNQDGSAKSGTVASGYISNNASGCSVLYSSDKTTKSGSATFFSQGTKAYTPGSELPFANKTVSHNVTVNYKDSWEGVCVGPGPMVYNKITTVNARVWNESSGGNTSNTDITGGLFSNKEYLNPHRFFCSVKQGLGFATGPTSPAIEPVYPETILMPFPKLAGAGLFTTSEGFLFGSIGFKLPFSLKVGLYASEKTLTYETFNWCTIAPKSLTATSWFGRNMLHITTKMQPILGKYSIQTLERGTYIRLGLVGPQKGLGLGTWLQIYVPKGAKFIK